MAEPRVSLCRWKTKSRPIGSLAGDRRGMVGQVAQTGNGCPSGCFGRMKGGFRQ